jgi:hypothetical protein
LGWGVLVCAADFHEIVVHRVGREGVNMVFDLLRKRQREARVSLAMLANDPVVSFKTDPLPKKMIA